MLDLLLYRLLASHAMDDPRVEPLLVELADQSMRDRVPYFGWLLEIVEDAALPASLRRAALGAMHGAHGWAVAECAVGALAHPDLRADALRVLARLAETAPMRWVHVAFHSDPEVRRAAYASSWPSKTRVFDPFLLSDPVVRDAVVAEHERSPMPFDAEDLPTILDAVERGHLSATSARAAFFHQKAKFLSALSLLGAEPEHAAKVAFDAALADPLSLGEGKRARARLVAFLRAFPLVDDAWLGLLKDQGTRGMRHRLAIAAWTATEGAVGEERDALAELVLLCDVRFAAHLPEEEARRRLRSLCKKRISAIDHPDAVKALVSSPLVAARDDSGALRKGRLDFEVLASLMAFLGSHVFERAPEWVGADALVLAISLDPEGAAPFCALPPRGPAKVVGILDKLTEDVRTRVVAGVLLHGDPARFVELGVTGPTAQAAVLACCASPAVATMGRERATAIATFVQALAGPGVLRKILPLRLAGRGDPTALDRALVRESALANDADPYVEHVSALPSAELVRLLAWIEQTEDFPMGKELALAHRLASSASAPVRAWAVSRLPAEDVPKHVLKELPRAVVGVAFRAPAAPAATIEEAVSRAVALLGSADPIAATDAAIERLPFGDALFDDALDRALVEAFGVRTGGLSPLGHAWLWRWDAHALVHLEICVASHASLADAVRDRLALRTRAMRCVSLEAIASALDILRFREKARFRSLVDAPLVDAIASALPGEAEVPAAKMLRRIFESSEVSLVDALPTIRGALPELGDEARAELRPIIDSRGLPARRAARAVEEDVDAETIARIRASSDLAALAALTDDPRSAVVQEATLRLLLLGEAGQSALADRIASTSSADRIAPIVSSLPLWADGASVERARSTMTDHPLTERAFRLAASFLERREGGAIRDAAIATALDAARDPLEPGWFRAEDWEKLVGLVDARVAARALATSPQAHASLRAIDVLLHPVGERGELAPEDADALRRYLDCGTERMGSQRRRAAQKLLDAGDAYALPIAVSSSLDVASGKSNLFAHVDGPTAAIVVRGLLAAGGTIVKEPSIVHHVVGMPFHTSEESFREILDRATTDAARMTAARHAGSRASRERKLMRVVTTFAWGVRVARRMLGKPMRVRMTGSQSLGFTRTRENVVYVTPLPILRGDRHGVEVVEALIVHEIGHHLYHAGPANEKVWDRAQKAGIGGLLNLVADEHLERNIRALDREHGDRLKRLAAYAFQHTRRMLPVRRVLSHVGAAAAAILPTVGLGVARADDAVLVETGSFLFTMEKSALAFSRFARALRMGLGNRHDDPRVAEALALFGPSFRGSSMEELLSIAEKLRDIFGWETNLCESFGAHESIEDEHADVDSVVWGEGLTQEEVDSMVRRVTERSEPTSSTSGGGGLAINVGADEKFATIDRVERKVFDATAHAPYARRVQRPAQLLRRYFEELGLGFRPERMRLSGRRLDQTRLLPLVLHGDPRLLVARHAFFARDLFLGIVVDCSGSMASRDNMERGKLFAALLAEAAAPLSGIDARILGFTDQIIYDCGDAKRPAAHALAAGGGNNDAAALYHLAKIAKQSQRRAKVLVMVSDGLPTECTVAALRGLVRQLGQRERMVCAQVAVQALAEVCFPHYVVLSDASIEATVNKFGALVAKLVARAIGSG